MGLKKFNYTVQSLGVIVPNAYARLTDIFVDTEGNANGTMVIQRNRESIDSLQPFDIVEVSCKVDKNLPIYEQLYNKAKETSFSDWEDDIV